jgi:transcriptional regulator with XRE-family HTH domain
MARIKPAAKSWAEWLKPLMDATDMSQAELAKRIVDAGGKASKQTVSQWVNAVNAADADTATIIAAIFAASPAEALRAAGYVKVAEVVGDRPAPVGGAASEPADPVILNVLGLKGLNEQDKADLIAFHRKRRARLEADILAMAELMRGERGQEN